MKFSCSRKSQLRQHVRLECVRLEDRTVPSILGTADSFAVLAGQTVTNTGPSVIDGDVGLSPGTSVVGFPPGSVTRPYTIHAADAVAAQAQTDLVTAYRFTWLWAGRCAQTSALTGRDLVGHDPPRALFFSNVCSVDGHCHARRPGRSHCAIRFCQIGSKLTTATNSWSSLINGCGWLQHLLASQEFRDTWDNHTAFWGNIL